MAVKKTQNDGYAQLRADMAAGTLAPAYLFHGEESYLREFCLSEIRRQLVPEGFEAFNFHRLEGKGLTAQALTEAVEAMPMMAERTMVQVVDWDVYKLPEEQRRGLIALLEDLPPYCCLVLVYDLLEYKPNRTYKKLYGALSAHVREVKFQPLNQDQLMTWVARRLKAAGHTIDVPTAEHLLFTCGALMNQLIPEIAKIAAYAQGERITRADIDAVASPVVEAQVFDMTRAVSKLLSLMGGELRRLHSARIALDAGRDRFWLMEQWNMRSDYQAKLLLENARRVSRPWCARAVRRCCETDLRIKSVSGADGAGELKLLLMELAQTSRA